MKRSFELLAILILLSATAGAQTPERLRAYNLGKNALAIQGYDPVAYFTQGKAIAGNRMLALSYEGVVYYFSSAQNKELFKSNPAAYEPQYGGWCAYAMGNSGEKVEIDPETFRITDGRLYLFYNRYFTNTLKSWNKNEQELRVKADANWRKLFH